MNAFYGFVSWCAVVLFSSGVGGGAALYLVVRRGGWGLSGAASTLSVSFVPIFHSFYPIWSILTPPVYSEFDGYSLPSFIFPFVFFFIDNSAARYCVSLSGWIRMDWQTPELPPTPPKGALFSP